MSLVAGSTQTKARCSDPSAEAPHQETGSRPASARTLRTRSPKRRAEPKVTFPSLSLRHRGWSSSTKRTDARSPLETGPSPAGAWGEDRIGHSPDRFSGVDESSESNARAIHREMGQVKKKEIRMVTRMSKQTSAKLVGTTIPCNKVATRATCRFKNMTDRRFCQDLRFIIRNPSGCSDRGAKAQEPNLRYDLANLRPFEVNSPHHPGRKPPSRKFSRNYRNLDRDSVLTLSGITRCPLATLLDRNHAKFHVRFQFGFDSRGNCLVSLKEKIGSTAPLSPY